MKFLSNSNRYIDITDNLRPYLSEESILLIKNRKEDILLTKRDGVLKSINCVHLNVTITKTDFILNVTKSDSIFDEDFESFAKILNTIVNKKLVNVNDGVVGFPYAIKIETPDLRTRYSIGVDIIAVSNSEYLLNELPFIFSEEGKIGADINRALKEIKSIMGE